VLGQEAVADKSNEITAIPRLLEHLTLKGALVTIDAMGTQVNIAQTILEARQLLLALKANHPLVFKDIETFFTAPPPDLIVDTHETTTASTAVSRFAAMPSATMSPGYSPIVATPANPSSPASP